MIQPRPPRNPKNPNRRRTDEIAATASNEQDSASENPFAVVWKDGKEYVFY